MTQQQLHDEAREVYRATYTALLPSYLHENAQKIAKEQYDQYIALFKSHVTQTEPVRNTDGLTQFVPDWSKVSDEINFIAQDESGFVGCYEFEPEQADEEWMPYLDDECRPYAKGYFQPPADWKTAIWKRPTE